MDSCLCHPGPFFVLDLVQPTVSHVCMNMHLPCDWQEHGQRPCSITNMRRLQATSSNKVAHLHELDGADSIIAAGVVDDWQCQAPFHSCCNCLSHLHKQANMHWDMCSASQAFRFRMLAGAGLSLKTACIAAARKRMMQPGLSTLWLQLSTAHLWCHMFWCNKAELPKRKISNVHQKVFRMGCYADDLMPSICNALADMHTRKHFCTLSSSQHLSTQPSYYSSHA